MSGKRSRSCEAAIGARVAGAAMHTEVRGPSDTAKAVKRSPASASVGRFRKSLGVSKQALGRVTNTELLERTVATLGGEEQARAWLNAPNWALGGKTPLEFADTELGTREVENLLGRIEHGVFS